MPALTSTSGDQQYEFTLPAVENATARGVVARIIESTYKVDSSTLVATHTVSVGLDAVAIDDPRLPQANVTELSYVNVSEIDASGQRVRTTTTYPSPVVALILDAEAVEDPGGRGVASRIVTLTSATTRSVTNLGLSAVTALELSPVPLNADVKLVIQELDSGLSEILSYTQTFTATSNPGVSIPSEDWIPRT